MIFCVQVETVVYSFMEAAPFIPFKFSVTEAHGRHGTCPMREIDLWSKGTATRRLLADDVKLTRAIKDHRCEVCTWRPPSTLIIHVRVWLPNILQQIEYRVFSALYDATKSIQFS